MTSTSQATSPRGFLQVLRNSEFRWLWFAGLQSLLGDQLARVALSLLVFDETKSGLLTASVYALTYVPAVLGSVLLGPLADRMPRRALLVCGDLIRAALLAIMAVPEVPLPVVALLLVLAVVVGAPWSAAEAALVADILDGEGYAIGTGLRIATVQGAQLVGFALGGAVVGGIGSHLALGVDAVSFLISATIIGLRLRPRPRAAEAHATAWRDGVRVIAGSQRLRSLIGFSWLLGVLVIPEGLAAPYAAHLGHLSIGTGLLLAAGPGGVMVGSLIFVRVVPEHVRGRLVGPLAILAGVPLLGCRLDPGLIGTCVLWALSGACTAYQVQVITEFVQTVPANRRGQGIAVASAGLLAVQGFGFALGGLTLEFWQPPTTVFAAGVAGIPIAAALTATRRYKRRQDVTHRPAHRVVARGYFHSWPWG